ncbi:hypothetical protein BAZ12_08690 [Elizabethkingia miricola]|nr:hypothetical protein BAZ12_08690 [Elizabethkingia miricola]
MNMKSKIALVLIGMLVLVVLFSISKGSKCAKYDDFRFITYEHSGEGVEIGSFSKIDKKGVLWVFLKRSKDSAYYKYQLSANEIEKLSIFSSKKLEDFVIRKQLDQGIGYAGSSNFLGLKLGNDEDKICFIKPFMDKDFNDTMMMLEDKVFKQSDSNKVAAFDIDFVSVGGEILKQERINFYLPQKQLPPKILKW